MLLADGFFQFFIEDGRVPRSFLIFSWPRSLAAQADNVRFHGFVFMQSLFF